MSGEILGRRDTSTVQQIMEGAYEILQGQPLYIAEDRAGSDRAFKDGAKRLDLIGVSPICELASDAVTRSAQNLGIVASREMHSRGPNIIVDHYLTSFAPLEQPLSDKDPILCITWGQFAGGKAFAKQLRRKEDLYGFFAERKDVRKLVTPETYSRCYAAGSTALRQTVHAPLPPKAQAISNRLSHCWLDTTPEEILTGQFPGAEVSVDRYPNAKWDLTALLNRAQE